MSGMSLAGSKTLDESRRKKDLRDELLAIEIANEAENERRVKDYQNPYAPKEVPPQYKTIAEQRADIMKLERDSLRMLEDIQIDDTEARKVVSWLREQPDRLVKFVAYGVSIRTEILKKANPRLIDASYIINIIRPILLNSNIALGFTSSGTAYNSLEAILKDYDIDDTLRKLIDSINAIGNPSVASQLNDLRINLTSLLEVYPNDADFGNIKLLQLPLQQSLVYKLSELIKKHSLPTATSIASVIESVLALASSDEDSSSKLIKGLQRKIGFKMENLQKDFVAFDADLAKSIELSQSGEIDKLYKNTELGVDIPLKEGQRLVNVIKGQPIGEDAYTQQKALISNPSQQVRMVIEYIQDPANDLHRRWEDAKQFIDEMGVRNGQGFLPEEYDFIKSIWVHYNQEYRDRVEQERVKSQNEGYRLQSLKYKPKKSFEENYVSSKKERPDDLLYDPFADLIPLTKNLKKSNIDKEKTKDDRSKAFLETKLELLKTFDNDDLSFLYRLIGDLITFDLQFTPQQDAEIDVLKRNLGVSQTVINKILGGTGDLPKEDIISFLKKMIEGLKYEIGNRGIELAVGLSAHTAPPAQPVMSGSQPQPRNYQYKRQGPPPPTTPPPPGLKSRQSGLAPPQPEKEPRPKPKGTKGITKFFTLAEEQPARKQKVYQAVAQPKPKVKITTEEEADTQFEGFLDELGERDEPEQKAILTNILDHFAKVSGQMTKNKQNKLIKDYDEGGKEEIIEFIQQAYNEQAVRFAVDKGGEYTPTQFGNKKGKSRNTPLKYGIGKVGRGVEVEPATPYKTFGKFLIHIPSLHDNIANFKYPSKASIPHIKRRQITDDYREFLKDLLENGKINEREYNRLCEQEKDHFGGIVKGAGLLEHFKVKPPKVDKGDTSRYELLIGEYKAGNNSPVMLKELRSLIIKFMDEGKIKRKDGQSLLVDLSTL